jgi:hypothetical protein
VLLLALIGLAVVRNRHTAARSSVLRLGVCGALRLTSFARELGALGSLAALGFVVLRGGALFVRSESSGATLALQVGQLPKREAVARRFLVVQRVGALIALAAV